MNGLLGRGYFAAGLHGDMKQAQRDRVMQGFRSGKTDILVCTDVAARGIDVDDVEAVFNYDLPQDDEYYVHRIGRTGRAGRVGRSFSFVSGREVYKLKEIQRYCKTKIYAQKVPSLNDVANTKMENVLEEIEQIIENEDLTKFLQIIEERVNESDYTAMDLAAAFLKYFSADSSSPFSNIQTPIALSYTGWFLFKFTLFRYLSAETRSLRERDATAALIPATSSSGYIRAAVSKTSRNSSEFSG